MALMKWKPNNRDPLEELFDLDRPLLGLPLFPSLTRRGSQEAWYPALDVLEEGNNYVVKADLPGLKKEQIQITADGSVLAVQGERKHEIEEKRKGYHRMERSYGIFQRSVDLGTPLDESKIKAKYHDGVLEITVPKSEASKARNIAIE